MPISYSEVSTTEAVLALRSRLIPKVRATDLARSAGVSRQYVYSVLEGRRPPSERLLSAAEELGLLVKGDP